MGSPLDGSNTLKLLKMQIGLALGQKEEDPERAWLELMSVRDRLNAIADDAGDDALLAADVDRVRGKVQEHIAALAGDVGDEVIAPLYSWIDLVRQRDRLDADVARARDRAKQARQSRGDPALPPSANEDEAAAALAAVVREHEALEAESAALAGRVERELGEGARRNLWLRFRATLRKRANVALVARQAAVRSRCDSLDLEAGWLRALSAAFRARRAFEEHAGEGGQLAELSRWRPDLVETVAEVVRSK